MALAHEVAEYIRDQYRGEYEVGADDGYTYSTRTGGTVIDKTSIKLYEKESLWNGAYEKKPTSDWNSNQRPGNITLTDDMGNAGVKIVSIDGIEYYDFSKQVNKMILNNAQVCIENRSDGGNDYLLEIYKTLQWFHNQVNHNAPWDLKRTGRWNEQLPELKDFNIRDSNGNFTKFVLNGDVIAAEDLGNITYGYWGRAIGFGETLIYAGGGYAAVGNNADDPRIYDQKQFYGDAENDHIMIEKGISWYNSAFKDDKPVFNPNLDIIKILFKGYDTKRNIGNKVEDVKDWFGGLEDNLPWNK